MQKNNPIYPPLTSKTKMADLLAIYPNLISLFPRLGISLGFGEKTAQQICHENNISFPLFVLICHVYTQNDYQPGQKELEGCTVEDIMRYLEASHVDYIDYKFPHIESHLRDISKDWSPKYQSLILNFFKDYKKEIVDHFNYEEQVVFPYIRSLTHPEDSRRAKPKNGMLDKQHGTIEDKMQDFVNLMVKYIPSDLSQRERVDMLIDLHALSEDIARHADIENKILIPYIKTLEENGKQN